MLYRAIIEIRLESITYSKTDLNTPVVIYDQFSIIKYFRNIVLPTSCMQIMKKLITNRLCVKLQDLSGGLFFYV